MNSNKNQTQRLLSLDVFRGITIALMIIVNSQASEHPYALLEHVTWNGCTLADLVFPFFLFIVGITTAISLQRHKAVELKWELYQTIFKRSVMLFLLGLFLNAFPYHYDISSLRIYGILQRIALCYLACSILYLNTSIKTQVILFIGILLGYWILLTQIPVPGFGANQLTAEGSWVAYCDQLLFSSQQLYFKVFDPEGILGTVPSIATTLFGVLVGQLLLSSIDKTRKGFVLAFTGCVFLIVAWVGSYSFPINKNLWTSTFVLWTSGWAALLFAFVYLLIDVYGVKRWSLAFKILGMNALFLFIVHVLLLKMQFAIKLQLANGQVMNAQRAIAYYLFGNLGPENSALLYSLAFLLLNFCFAVFLYRRKLFISV